MKKYENELKKVEKTFFSIVALFLISATISVIPDAIKNKNWDGLGLLLTILVILVLLVIKIITNKKTQI